MMNGSSALGEPNTNSFNVTDPLIAQSDEVDEADKETAWSNHDLFGVSLSQNQLVYRLPC